MFKGWGCSATKSAQAGAAVLFDDNLDLAPRLEPIAWIEAVQHPESFDGAVGNRHPARQFIDRVARSYRDELQPQRLGILDLGQAHAPKCTDRFAKGAVDLGRAMLGGKDEAINVAAEADGVKPEIPLVAFGDSAGARESVDGDVFDGRRVDILDPARSQVFGERLFGRHPHHVEPERLAAAALDAEHRLGGIVERKAVRRREGEAELRVQEAPAAHKTLARVLAVDDAVNVGQIGSLRAREIPTAIGRRRPVLPRIGERIGDALGSRRMRRQKVGRARIDGAGLFRLQVGIVLHRSEEANRAIRVVAGARGDADADAVGLEFLGARKARQREFRFGERKRSGCRIGDHIGDDAADKVGLTRLLFADLGVAGDHMAHLMRQNRGQFGIVVRQRDQAARDIELAGRQSKSVDRL